MVLGETDLKCLCHLYLRKTHSNAARRIPKRRRRDIFVEPHPPPHNLEPQRGGIKVSFTKKGVDALAIYSRLRGTATWNQLAVDTTSPYDDTSALAVAGVPEAREYMARGVLADEEIGIASDIASITFAG